MANSRHVLKRVLPIVCALGLVLTLPCNAAQARGHTKKSPAMITLPGGAGGIGFDDLRYFSQLHRVVVPAAGTGDLDLINPQTGAVTVIPDVAARKAAPHGDDQGSTSVAYAMGYLFAGDHGRVSIAIVDPNKKAVIGRKKLAADYDFIRYVASRHELWVTEPRKHRIEIFKVAKGKTPTLRHEAFIAVPGGPEALVIDNADNVAYTNSRSTRTFAMSLSRRRIVARWPNSCQQSRGLAKHDNFLFVACKEGTAVTLDTKKGGKKISKAPAGQGVDLIAYDSASHNLYVPGAKSATLAILHVSSDGHLHHTVVYHAAKDAHCVTADGASGIFVCAPQEGQILRFAP